MMQSAGAVLAVIQLGRVTSGPAGTTPAVSETEFAVVMWCIVIGLVAVTCGLAYECFDEWRHG